MKQFSSFGIKPPASGLKGDKIKIERLLNRPIIVEKFEIKPSRFLDKGNGKCLHMQIKIGEAEHVVFTGSSVLMDSIQQVDQNDFPFTTTIVKDSDRLMFT